MDVKLDLTQVISLVISLVVPVLVIVFKWLIDRGRLIGLTLLIIVIPICFYYLTFVTEQRDYFAKRNLRELRDIGDQINSKVDNLASNLLNLAQKTKQESEKPETVRPVVERISAPSVELSVKQEQGSFSLFLTYHDSEGFEPSNFPVKSKIETLVDPYVSPHLTDESKAAFFDAILVSEQESARVIFHRGGRELGIGSLDALYDERGSKLELKTGQSSRLVNVQLAGTNYVLFMQPFRLTLAAEGDTDKRDVWWVVAGLTRSARFRDESFEISYTALIALVSLVVLSALGWPLLKLILIGPRDRLRRGDLALTLVSALMGTALLTFLLLDAYTWIRLVNTLDRNLVNLSETITSNFQKEISDALAQLRQLNEQLGVDIRIWQSGGLERLENSKGTPFPPIMSTESRMSVLMKRVNILAQGVNWESARYPYFNTATWIDPTGLQRIKWTTGPDVTAFLDVSGRRYFKNVVNGKLWKISSQASDSEYTVESVRSRTTGEKVAVIATKMPGSNWVSTLDTRMMSLTGTTLPAGYGYAVIDDDGNVLFHSNEASSLEENLFEKCDNDRLLRAVVPAGNQFLNVRYLGKGHRMFVSPLTGTPFTLVVFWDKQIPRTINLELLSLALIPYLAFGVCVLSVALIIYLPRQGQITRWLWPDQERTGHYRLIIIINGVLWVIFLAVAQVENEWLLATCCFLVPAIAVAITARILTHPPFAMIRGKFARLFVTQAASYRTLYIIAFASLLVLLTILPATSFFQIARSFELKLLVKHGQVSLAEALERRIQRVESQYASINIGGGQRAKDAFLAQRLESNSDIYDSFFFGTTHDATSTGTTPFTAERPGAVDSLFKQILPLYNNAAVESQGFSPTTSSDPLWRWSLSGEDYIRLEKDKDGREAELSIALISTVPRIGAPGNLSGWVIVILMTGSLLFLTYLIVYCLARNFFMLYRGVPTPNGIENGPSLRNGNIVLIRPPGSLSVWNPQFYHLIDLRRLTTQQEPRSDLLSDLPSDGVTLVVDHFEHCMNEPLVNYEKLRIIETLLIECRPFVIVSTVDPMRFRLAPDEGLGVVNEGEKDANQSSQKKVPNTDVEPPGKRGTTANKSAAARWAAALSPFVTVHLPDNASREFIESNPGFLEALKTNRPWCYLERLGNEILGGKDLARVNRGKHFVYEEYLAQVIDQARPYHQTLWATCSLNERSTLIHLATDGMINAKNTELRQLIKRGLVVLDPTLRLMDESFRRFILSAAGDEDTYKWQKAGRSTWQLMKIPLLLVLLSVTLFLFLTQRDIYNSTVTFALAVAVGLGALFTLPRISQGGRGGAAQGQE